MKKRNSFIKLELINKLEANAVSSNQTRDMLGKEERVYELIA